MCIVFEEKLSTVDLHVGTADDLPPPPPEALMGAAVAGGAVLAVGGIVGLAMALTKRH